MRTGNHRVRKGFTLLEALVATTIMAVAVTALVSNLTGSLRNLSRLNEQDRASLLSSRKLEEILLGPPLPRYRSIAGRFEQPITGEDNAEPATWRVRVEPVELPEVPTPGIEVLDRVEFEAIWKSGSSERSFRLVTYRRGLLLAEDLGLRR